MRWPEKTDLQRFEEKFVRITECGCWIWIGSGTQRYGNFHLPNYPIPHSKMVTAHRASLWIYKQQLVPENMEILHTCDVGFCCNPDHLVIGTHKQNMQDMSNKGRCTSGKIKLTEQDVIEILTSDKNTKEIARELGIDSGHCSRVRNFKVKCWEYLKNDERLRGKNVSIY